MSAIPLPLLINFVAKEHFQSNDDKAVLGCLLSHTSNVSKSHATARGAGSRKQIMFALHAHGSSSFACDVRHSKVSDADSENADKS